MSEWRNREKRRGRIFKDTSPCYQLLEREITFAGTRKIVGMRSGRSSESGKTLPHLQEYSSHSEKAWPPSNRARDAFPRNSASLPRADESNIYQKGPFPLPHQRRPVSGNSSTLTQRKSLPEYFALLTFPVWLTKMRIISVPGMWGSIKCSGIYEFSPTSGPGRQTCLPDRPIESNKF